MCVVTLTEAEFDSSVPPSSRRRLGNGLNDLILDALLRHRHFLLMAENGVAGDVVIPIRQAMREIRASLIDIVPEAAASDLSFLLAERQEILYRRLGEILAVTEIDATRTMRDRLEQVVTREITLQNGLLRRLIPDQIVLDLVGPDPTRISTILASGLGGVHYADRMRRNFGAMEIEMRRGLATSIALGEGIGPAARRLRNTVDGLGVQRSVLIARSEIQRASNDAANDVYRRNADVIQAIQVVETLDGRTCLICAARDGQVHPVTAPASDLPPYHAACRGFQAPITRSLADLGIDLPDISQSTRASMDGQVPASVDYESWFAQQSEEFQRDVLGATRFARYRAGLPLRDMARSNRVLGIDELPIP